VNWSVSNLSGSNHTSLVYDGLALGLRINANGTNGTTQIMAINSVKVVTTGKTVVVPVILNQPTSPNPVAWGDPHTYSVVASGGGDTGGELSYQWKKNGMNIDGATSASYTIPELDYSHAGTYSVVVTNSIGSTTSADAVLFVNPPAPPTIANLIDNGIDGNPVSLTVASGSSASFTVTGVGAGLSYKWQKSTDDGTTFTDIPGATSRTYTIARTQGSSVGLYRGVVMNSSGSATSTAASLALIYNFTGITPSGYAASATGGDTATSVEVSNLADFKAQAESATAAVITVNGAINLGGKVSVKSNKTIQGKDGEATLIGNLELASGVSNVVIRGINITNPAGSGLTITGASNVYINHVSFYDCSDTLLAITGGADNVTVSWSEFYYTAANDANKAVLVGATGETKPMRVTFDHNWWSDNVETHMPDTTYGRVHMYNNLFQNEAGTAMGNTTGTLVRANAQLFSEHNQYTGVNSPLTKEGTNIGLVRVIGDVYTASSGTAAHAGGDFITFAPTYSYQLITTGSVTSTIAASAGNLAGASTTTPTPSGTASVTSTATTVPLGGSFTLTAVPNGLTVAPDAPVPPYQWRLNGTPIGGSSTSPTLTVTQATGSNTGNYTVAILLANGETVVSTPLTITATSGSSSVPSSNSEAAGGGGAPSAWFFGALALLATLRRFLIPRKAA
jgi:pectate lyase